MIETKDLVFLFGGIALLGLTALPLICGRRVISVPLIYVTAGALLALLLPDWPIADPRQSGLALVAIEHLTELIVIIALAGAGLAIDRRPGKEGWSHTQLLLIVVMPATIGAVVLLGQWAGLGIASAMLLASSLAPTDPVLAREVAVGGPNEGDEDDVRVSLTAEAGLNDGLAFPFVWLAILLATAATEGTGVDWTRWALFDVGWRIAVAGGVGLLTGNLGARFVMGPWGDAQSDGQNAGLVLLGTTFLAYGATEALDGYGFLAVFIAARAGRSFTRDTEHDGYVSKPHRYSEQFEKILLAVLLLWLGGFAVSGVLADTRWQDIAVASALIFVVRPLVGYIALMFTGGDRFEHFATAFFGIRGMGSFFYIAYAISHAPFAEADAVWRIATITVLLSILVHGALAPIIMTRIGPHASSDVDAAEAAAVR